MGRESENRVLVGCDANLDVLDEHLLGPLLGQPLGGLGLGKQEESLARVVNVEFDLDPTLWIEHERVTPLSVVCWNAVGHHVVDVLETVVTLDDEYAVSQLE